MIVCYVGMGSNIEKEINVMEGLKQLESAFGTLVVSPIYQTTPVGFVGQDFFNLVVRFDTLFSIYEVIHKLRQIEIKQGRRSDSQKFTARHLDLDLLIYGETIIQEPQLTIPRPDIETHLFVLQPLADIAPHEKHPITQKTFLEMLEQRIHSGH